MYEVPITQRASAAAAHGTGCLPQIVWCSQSDRRGTSWLYYSLRLGAVRRMDQFAEFCDVYHTSAMCVVQGDYQSYTMYS